MEAEPTFNADVYIFCYFSPESHETADPMNLHQWSFYFFPKERLVEILDGRKSVSLKRLEMLGEQSYSAEELREHVTGSGASK